MDTGLVTIRKIDAPDAPARASSPVPRVLRPFGSTERRDIPRGEYPHSRAFASSCDNRIRVCSSGRGEAEGCNAEVSIAFLPCWRTPRDSSIFRREFYAARRIACLPVPHAE